MLIKTLRIKLLSDLCPASGDGFAGILDTDICYEDNGRPFIPGKRIKGCLRECGLDILSVDNSYETDFTRLFGSIGEQSSAEMTIGNGQIENYSEAEMYTSTRSRTRMENGKAAPGSLRTIRVINKGITFEFPVTLSEDLEGFFKKCYKSLRSMGLNRSRGLGEIECSLEESKCVQDESEQETSHETSQQSGDECKCPAMIDYTSSTGEIMKSISYTLTLVEPTISAERSGKPFGCEDYIFGSAILGAFAGRHMKKFKIDMETAYKDEVFRRIFLEGVVKFTAAMPLVDEKVYYPAPNTLKTNKIKELFADDSSAKIVEDKSEKNPICKKLGGFLSFGSSGLVERMTPTKSVFLHHARPHDKSVGRADSDAGEFYSYEALSEGQKFAGSIIGARDYIEMLKNLFDDNAIFWIGRSRTAQYGKVSISFCDAPDSQGSLKLEKGDKFRMVTVTPMILEDEHGINTTNLNLIESAFGSEYTITRSSCTETTIAGYYGKWRLPKTQQRAVAEGSVVVFEYNGNSTEIYDGFMGIRNGEGFGQFRIELVPKIDAIKKVEELSFKSVLKYQYQNEKVEAILGAQYGDRISDPPQNSVLHRVIAAAKICNNFSTLAKKLCDIKQPKQQRAALSFVCNKNEMYFKTNPMRLSSEHISRLMENNAAALFNELEKNEHYQTYKRYLTAAALRIRQKRRELERRTKK